MTKEKTFHLLEELVVNLVRKVPELLAIAVMAGGFLWFIDRKEKRAVVESLNLDRVSEQRINHCHDVQEAGHQVMAETRDGMNEQTEAWQEVTYNLMTLTGLIQRHIVEHAANHGNNEDD